MYVKSGFIFPLLAGGSGSGRGGGSGGAVRPLGGYQVKPRYPELARRLGIEGTVLPNAKSVSQTLCQRYRRVKPNLSCTSGYSGALNPYRSRYRGGQPSLKKPVQVSDK